MADLNKIKTTLQSHGLTGEVTLGAMHSEIVIPTDHGVAENSQVRVFQGAGKTKVEYTLEFDNLMTEKQVLAQISDFIQYARH